MQAGVFMKNGMVMYEKIYQIIKNKIECGLLPDGYRLPSRAELCKEYHTSEKTIRRVVEMLADEGLVETSQRKRPTVTFCYEDGRDKKGLLPLQKAESTAANDVLRTGVLLCYPVIINGVLLCSESEWSIPEAILRKMDPADPVRFWRMSNQFWRFFIARNGNDLILRAVDSLGFGDLDPRPGSMEIRLHYYEGLQEFVKTVKTGGALDRVPFDDLSDLYSFVPEMKNAEQAFLVGADSPLRVGTKGLYQRITPAEEQYSRVYLDILALIALGRYQPGDRLPSHAKLRRIYEVSVDTTTKAIGQLERWGVVTAIRGKGIFVAMDLKAMGKIEIEPELIACHIRKYLDSLELLSLTIENVAAHAAEHVTAEEADALKAEMEKLWDHAYLYQLSPVVLLEFIRNHIQYRAMQVIYKVVLNNYHIGRSIPKLIHHDKNKENQNIYKQCIEAAEILKEGDAYCFAKKAAVMFRYTHGLIVEECRKQGYLDAALKVYDGELLWK